MVRLLRGTDRWTDGPTDRPRWSPGPSRFGTIRISVMTPGRSRTSCEMKTTKMVHTYIYIYIHPDLGVLEHSIFQSVAFLNGQII